MPMASQHYGMGMGMVGGFKNMKLVKDKIAENTSSGAAANQENIN
jgi:hypothetical protein